MKQRQERESMPLWVWLAFGLMAIGAVAYVAGYWMFEELIAHFRK
jgi:nitrate reductase NapE component